ncbi:MAG: DcrB-related protein [Chloroflexi bacterium]|nr:DcrB-related protein [Chloroflexota bacterium]
MRLRSLVWFVALGLLAACQSSLTTPTVPGSGPSPTPYTAIPTATPTPPLPPGTARYVNDTHGFSLEYPVSWSRREAEGGSPVVTLVAPAGMPRVLVFLKFEIEDVPLAQRAQEAVAALGNTLSDLQVLEEGDTKLESGAAYRVEIAYRQEGQAMRARLLLLGRGTGSFLMMGVTAATDFPGQEEAISGVLRSFALRTPQPLGLPREQSLVLVGDDPVTLDPALSRDLRSHQYVVQLFGGLVRLDDEMRVQPDLAERWEVTGGGTVYTFFLRRGATFHDGKQVTAQDFKYALERAADPATGSETALTYLGDILGVREKLGGRSKEVKGVEVVDEHTLRITIDAPKAYFLAKLTYPTAAVVDRANVEMGGAQWWRNPNGTGPFRLKAWVRGELLALQRNDGYHLDPPRIPFVVFRILAGVPLRMYEDGAIDAAPLSDSEARRILDPRDPLHAELRVSSEMSISYVGFNVRQPPFDDARVRRAFALALDRDRLVKVVQQGTAIKAEGFLPPGMPGYDPGLRGTPFDQEQARQLLAESKYGSAKGLPALVFTSAGTDTLHPTLAAIADMWRRNLGVEVEVRLLDPRSYFYGLKQEPGNLFDYGWVADYPDPENVLDVLFHSTAENNEGGYASKEADRLLEQARTEGDVGRRLAMYRQAERLLLEDVAAIPLAHHESFWLAKPYLRGFRVNPQGLYTLSSASLLPR